MTGLVNHSDLFLRNIIKMTDVLFGLLTDSDDTICLFAGKTKFEIIDIPIRPAVLFREMKKYEIVNSDYGGEITFPDIKGEFITQSMKQVNADEPCFFSKMKCTSIGTVFKLMNIEQVLIDVMLGGGYCWFVR